MGNRHRQRQSLILGVLRAHFVQRSTLSFLCDSSQAHSLIHPSHCAILCSTCTGRIAPQNPHNCLGNVAAAAAAARFSTAEWMHSAATEPHQKSSTVLFSVVPTVLNGQMAREWPQHQLGRHCPDTNRMGDRHRLRALLKRSLLSHDGLQACFSCCQLHSQTLTTAIECQ